MIGLLIPKNEKIRHKQKIIRLLITKIEKIRDKQKNDLTFNYEKLKNQRQTKNY